MKALRHYPFSLICVAIILWLTLNKTPSTGTHLFPNADKVAHLLMFFGLSITIWWEHLKWHGRTLRTLPLWAIAAPICLGGLTEIMQEQLTTYRGGEWADFGADVFGVVLGALFGRFVLLPIYRD